MNINLFGVFYLRILGLAVALLGNGLGAYGLSDARDQLAAKYCGSSDAKGYMEKKFDELRGAGKGAIQILRHMATDSNCQYQGCGIAFLERLEDKKSHQMFRRLAKDTAQRTNVRLLGGRRIGYPHAPRRGCLRWPIASRLRLAICNDLLSNAIPSSYASDIPAAHLVACRCMDQRLGCRQVQFALSRRHILIATKKISGPNCTEHLRVLRV
jgi:hypothetical protein